MFVLYANQKEIVNNNNENNNNNNNNNNKIIIIPMIIILSSTHKVIRLGHREIITKIITCSVPSLYVKWCEITEY